LWVKKKRHPRSCVVLGKRREVRGRFGTSAQVRIGRGEEHADWCESGQMGTPRGKTHRARRRNSTVPVHWRDLGVVLFLERRKGMAPCTCRQDKMALAFLQEVMVGNTSPSLVNARRIEEFKEISLVRPVSAALPSFARLALGICCIVVAEWLL